MIDLASKEWNFSMKVSSASQQSVSSTGDVSQSPFQKMHEKFGASIKRDKELYEFDKKLNELKSELPVSSNFLENVMSEVNNPYVGLEEVKGLFDDNQVNKSPSTKHLMSEANNDLKEKFPGQNKRLSSVKSDSFNKMMMEKVRNCLVFPSDETSTVTLVGHVSSHNILPQKNGNFISRAFNSLKNSITGFFEKRKINKFANTFYKADPSSQLRLAKEKHDAYVKGDKKAAKYMQEVVSRDPKLGAIMNTETKIYGKSAPLKDFLYEQFYHNEKSGEYLSVMDRVFERTNINQHLNFQERLALQTYAVMVPHFTDDAIKSSPTDQLTEQALEAKNKIQKLNDLNDLDKTNNAIDDVTKTFQKILSPDLKKISAPQLLHRLIVNHAPHLEKFMTIEGVVKDTKGKDISSHYIYHLCNRDLSQDGRSVMDKILENKAEDKNLNFEERLEKYTTPRMKSYFIENPAIKGREDFDLLTEFVKKPLINQRTKDIDALSQTNNNRAHADIDTYIKTYNQLSKLPGLQLQSIQSLYSAYNEGDSRGAEYITAAFSHDPELKDLMNTETEINGRKGVYKDFLFDKSLSTDNKSVMDRVFEESETNKKLTLQERIAFYTNGVIGKHYFPEDFLERDCPEKRFQSLVNQATQNYGLQ